MPTRTVVIGSPEGLHARPAQIVVRAAAAAAAPVHIGRPGEPIVSAASLLSLMTLGVKGGDEVEVSGAMQADVDTIAELLERDLDA
jgi:phosphocarrier protein HPr